MFGFTGEMKDLNELLYLRNRHYNPMLGVFPSLDPLEGDTNQSMTLNRYSYVQGNVVNAVDPTGLIFERPEWWAGCTKELFQQSDCERLSPVSGTVSIDLKRLDWSLYFRWGVVLTVDCRTNTSIKWTKTHKDHLVAAFRKIDRKLLDVAGRGFKQVFGGLEIRHIALGGDPSNAGETTSEFLLTFNETGRGDVINVVNEQPVYEPRSTAGQFSRETTGEYGLDVVGDVGIERTIIHELGHVFDFRTIGNCNKSTGGARSGC